MSSHHTTHDYLNRQCRRASEDMSLEEKERYFGVIRPYDASKDSQIWGKKYFLRNILIVGVSFYLLGYLSTSQLENYGKI